MRHTKAYYNYLNNMFKVLRSDAVGQVYEDDGTIDRQENSYVLSPLDVEEVEQMCIGFGLSYELIGTWGIRIWKP
jgi:hypothetical protein